MNTDMSKVEAFAGQVVTDIAAAFSGVMTNIGHKLGLYKAMVGAGWVSSDQLAEKTGTDERYVREWLNNQTAGGYVHYDVQTKTYRLPDEHIPVLAAGDGVQQNVNPVSRLYYAASTAVCTPCSKSQEVGLALGAQAGEARLSEVLREAGFNNIRCAAETPFNLIIEARR